MINHLMLLFSVVVSVKNKQLEDENYSHYLIETVANHLGDDVVVVVVIVVIMMVIA